MRTPSPDGRPNVLWITTDQQRFDTIGALGYPHMHTPNLDRIVDSGVGFSRAYCQSPICTPSRASFMTGKYPSAVHQNRNGAAYFPPGYREEPLLVSKLLANAGYDCGLVGKLHLASNRGRREERSDDGFQYYQYSTRPDDPTFLHEDYHLWLIAKGQEPANVLGRKAKERHGHERFFPPSSDDDGTLAPLHQATWCAEKATEFITTPREDPWLLCLNFYYPHPPFDPPWEFYRRFEPSSLPRPHYLDSDLENQAKLSGITFQTDARRPDERDIQLVRAAYYAMIELVDEQIGRLLEVLADSGELEQTLIIFNSDHGEMLGDHGLTRKGCRFYEGLVRVPLLWSWPSSLAEGLVSDALVELTDIAPTVLEIVGLDIPRQMHGRSLLPILTGQSAPDHHREHVRSEYYDGQGGESMFGTMYRDLRWKLVVYHGHPFGELYDMDNDPGEFTNLWDDPDSQDVKLRLMKESLDSTVLAMDIGPPLTPPLL